MHPSFPQDSWTRFRSVPFVSRLLTSKFRDEVLRDWPSIADYQAFAEEDPGFKGLALKFALEEKPGQRRRRRMKKSEQRTYEQWIFESAEIPTRARNFHDFFNAIIWSKFPLSKRSLHKKAFEIQKTWPLDPEFQKGRRSRLQDRLTCFDEGGIVLELKDGEDAEAVQALLRGHGDSSKQDFVSSQKERFTVFGHGILEVLMKEELKDRSADFKLPLLNASCIVLPPGEGSLDDRLSLYLEGFDEHSADHGTVYIHWLA